MYPTLDRTADGVEIKPGLKIWTNDLTRAVVTDVASEAHWWDCDCVGGKKITLNGERMTTVHPFTREKA